MSQTRERRRVALAASDADGAVYNVFFHTFMAVGAARFGARLVAIANNADANNFINQGAIKSCLDEMKTFFNSTSDKDIAEIGFGNTTAKSRLAFLLALQKVDLAFYDELLLRVNSELIKYLVELADEVDEVHVAIASRRQDKDYDALAQQTNATGLFFRDIAVIKNKLASKHPDKAFLFDAAFVDIFNEMALGSHAQATPSKLSQFDCDYHSDGSKIATHIMLIHGFLVEYSKKHPNVDVSLAYHFFDDLMSLHSKASGVFGQHQQLIPANVSFQSVHYECNSTTLCDDATQGSGAVNPDYAKFIADFSCILGNDYEEEPMNDGCSIDDLLAVAETLLLQHPGFVRLAAVECDVESESDEEDSLDCADKFSKYSVDDDATETETDVEEKVSIKKRQRSDDDATETIIDEEVSVKRRRFGQ